MGEYGADLPMLLCRMAVVVCALCCVVFVRFVCDRERTQTRSTDSWSGLRALFIGAVFVLHVGYTHLNCAGPFLILSGAVMVLNYKGEATTKCLATSFEAFL